MSGGPSPRPPVPAWLAAAALVAVALTACGGDDDPVEAAPPSCQRTVRIDVDEPKILAGNRILILTAEEAVPVTRNQIVDAGRIDSVLVLILLDGSNVFLSAKDEFLLRLTLRLHYTKRNNDSGRHSRGGDDADQSREREACVMPSGSHDVTRRKVCLRLC